MALRWLHANADALGVDRSRIALLGESAGGGHVAALACAQRLVEAGVPTELYVAPGGFHGFDTIAPQATVSKRFTAAWNDALATRFKVV